MPEPRWYQQPLSLGNMDELFRFLGEAFPPPLRVLASLHESGQKTASLREWITTSGVDPRNKYREKFVDWLAKLAEAENDLLGVEPFDVEAAKKPLRQSGEIPITIYSVKYLEALDRYYKKSGKNANDYANNRNRRKGKRATNSQQECSKDGANVQEENEDSCGKDGSFSLLNDCTDKKRDSLSSRERESKENNYEEMLNYYGEN